MLVKKLNEVKSTFQETGKVDQAVSETLAVFDEIGEVRFDVANSVFDYHPDLQIAFCKEELKPKILEFKEEEPEQPEAYLEIFSMLYLSWSSRNPTVSFSVVELTQSILSEEQFQKLEGKALSKQREFMREMLKPINGLNQRENIEGTREFYKSEYEGTYYVDHIKSIFEDLVDETKQK